VTTRRHNLPAPRIQLVGREPDSASLRELVRQAPGRLVTLTGAGGCGKTQLALHVAAELLETFPHGVWLVDLAPVQAGHLVPYAVAAVLGCRERAHRTITDTLIAWLAARDLLLVLDNCEHVVQACARLAEDLLNGCPRLRLLATSREQLRIQGERVWRVPSLASPDPTRSLAAAELATYPAVRLFVQRAQAVEPTFALGPPNAAAVAAVCARLDGLPLALELAAAHVPVLSLSQILDRLDDSFRLLVGGSRTAPARQQTLRATLDWSHRLLSPAEQAVFRRLAVFAGDWSLDAAEAVCSDAALARADVLDLLARLVDTSLVVPGERDGRARYRLLEPIRQYAWQHLAACGEVDAVRRRHATTFLAFAEALGRGPTVAGAQRRRAVEALSGEYRNLQAALQWALDAGDADIGLRLAWTLEFVWKFRLVADDGRRWVEQVLRLPGAEAPTAARAVALLTAAWLRGAQDRRAAEALHAQALPLARRLGDPWILFVALSDRGLLAMHRGDYGTAHACWDEGLSVTRASGDRAAEAILLHNLGRLAIFEGDYVAGRARCEEALHVAQALDDYWTQALALESLWMAALGLGELGVARAHAADCLRLYSGAPYPTAAALRALAQVELAEGRAAEAGQLLGRALAAGQDSGIPSILAGAVDTLAGLAAQRRQPALAVRLAAAAEAAWAAHGEVDFPVHRALRDQWLLRLRRGLRAADAERWWAEGQSLALNEAIALAERELLHASTPVAAAASAAPAPLTPRQLEVAVLVAQGLTNRQIAERLVVTEAAAAKHVEHILNRLGVGTRAQIAAWAAARGLVGTRAG